MNKKQFILPVVVLLLGGLGYWGMAAMKKPPVEKAVNPDPTMTVVIIEDTAIPPTPTLRVYQGGCRNPNSVNPDEEGDMITVCGVVTNFGEFECETCS